MEKKKVTIPQLSKALADTQQELADALDKIKQLEGIIKSQSLLTAELNKVIEYGTKVNADLRKKNSLLMEVRPLISNLLANHESVLAAMHKINEASFSGSVTDGCSSDRASRH